MFTLLYNQWGGPPHNFCWPPRWILSKLPPRCYIICTQLMVKFFLQLRFIQYFDCKCMKIPDFSRIDSHFVAEILILGNNGLHQLITTSHLLWVRGNTAFRYQNGSLLFSTFPYLYLNCADRVQKSTLTHCDGVWHHILGSTLAQIMACSLTTSSHYLNPCWLITSVISVALTQDQFHWTCSRYQFVKWL